MEYYIWIILFFCIFIPMINAGKAFNVRKIIKRRRKKGIKSMNELIKDFINKEVVIYVSGSGSSAVSGFIRQIEDGWIKVEKPNNQFEIISIDYISRIQEYPRNSKGKKKMIFSE